MGMEDFFANLREAAENAATDIFEGPHGPGREVSAEELMRLTDEGQITIQCDRDTGLTWGMLNTNSSGGVVYCRHATALWDPNHRSHRSDFTIT